MKSANRNHPDQLRLFAPSPVPERFRIDDATRERGMRHVAELKALLDSRYPATRDHGGSESQRSRLGARASGRAA